MGGEKQRIVLFVCTENRFRSQVAEAYFNAMAPPGWVAVSAGAEPAEVVHPLAVELMLEEGIDLSKKKPKLLTKELQEAADVAVIVCGESEKGKCPAVFAKHVEQWLVPDPAKMPKEEAKRVRDEIKARVADLVERIRSGRLGGPAKWSAAGRGLRLGPARESRCEC